MKNIDYVNKKLSKEKGISIEIREKINNYYWDTVKTRLRELKSQGIYIKELGTMEVSPFKINEYIKRIRTFIKNVRRSHKYGEERKERIITDYKKNYKKCIDMRTIVNADLEFKKTYDKHENVESISGICEISAESNKE